MSHRRNICVLSVTLLLVACVQVRANVEIFHKLPSDFSGTSVAILPADNDKENTIEFETYSAKLAEHLRKVGLRVVSIDTQPDYLVLFDYAIGSGQQITGTYSVPQYGVTGYSSAQTYGSIQSYGGYGTYSGTTYLNPTYGVTGYTSHSYTNTQFPRSLLVSIYKINREKPDASDQVYQMTVSSSGRCGALSEVIDEMLNAGFEEFPGESGTSRKVIVPAKADC